MKNVPSDFDDNPFLRTIDLAYSDKKYREDREGMGSRYIR